MNHQVMLTKLKERENQKAWSRDNRALLMTYLNEVLEDANLSEKAMFIVDPVKEQIARSWPDRLDDTCAREEWGWQPKWNLDDMTDDMLSHIREKIAAGLY